MQVKLELSDEQVAELERISAQRQRPREELLQHAVALYLAPERKPHLLDFFGVLKGRVEDGLVFQNRMRQEWDRSE